MRISDWSSDVCSSDLEPRTGAGKAVSLRPGRTMSAARRSQYLAHHILRAAVAHTPVGLDERTVHIGRVGGHRRDDRILAGIGQPAFLGIGAAQTQRVAGPDPRAGEQLTPLRISVMRIQLFEYGGNTRSAEHKERKE